MGFKVDSSFLRFLTMGAYGVRRVRDELRELGFNPIELERYCTSNKIWATKVKRLRLPDLLCVQTGLRVEVRAKSDLKIRMSDAPENPERKWDAGLRNQDVVALIAWANYSSGAPQPTDHAVYFSVNALRKSVDTSTLGSPKSASEGAERDRTWPSVVPSRPGKVLQVTGEQLKVIMEGDGLPPRKQTYTLRGKHPYLAPGTQFSGSTAIIAGTPEGLVDLDIYRDAQYDPLAQLQSDNPLDRYAGAKALRFREDLHAAGIVALEALLDVEQERRVALEMAASAAYLGRKKGEDRISHFLFDPDAPDLSMEAILILTELRCNFAKVKLLEAATGFPGDERRQAAIWGLGKAGHQSYEDLVRFISDDDENVAYHAIASFDSSASQTVIEGLTTILVGNQPRAALAALEALRVIGSLAVLDCLLAAANQQPDRINWVLAAIGKLPVGMVRQRLQGMPILARIEPMLLVADGANWLTSEDAKASMNFLTKQNL